MIIHKKSFRLAALYLTILMAISLSFSIVVYQLSTEELDRGLRRPGTPSGLMLRGNNMESELREEIYREQAARFDIAKERVRNRLIFINLLIFAGGGVLSYILAVRTLRPIEEASKAQSRFSSDASHELRTPLAIMKSEIEVALLDKDLSLKDAKQLLKSNLEETNKLSLLSERLLQLSRGERLQKEDLKPTPLHPMAQSVRKSLAKQLVKKHMNLTVDVNPKHQALCDPTSLQEILTILVDNSIKYCPNGTEISILSTETKKDVVVEVKDNGPGIPREKQALIFERFYRLDDSRSSKITGYGLGLAIAKSLTELQGGTISYNDNEVGGSSFRIRLLKG